MGGKKKSVRGCTLNCPAVVGGRTATYHPLLRRPGAVDPSMCGVFGVVDLDRHAAGAPWTPEELDRVARARDVFAHRGPDGAGLWHAPGVVLAHRRLAILDLSPAGHQPMPDGRGGALTFNGEIYNYIELRDTLPGGAGLRSGGDTRILVETLAQRGLAPTLAGLRGMYAFGWWDAQAGAVHLARDPIGKKPLYVWQQGACLAFASTLPALVDWLAGSHVSLTIDPVAIEHHLAGGYIAAPRTVFREVSKFCAGESATFSRAGLTRHPPRPLPLTNRPRPLSPAVVDELDGLLNAAVRRRLRSDVPVATFLSGGLDSSLVTALAARHQPGITAFTVSTDNHNQAELTVARKVARATGVAHEILPLRLDDLALLPTLVRHYGEPFGDSSALPTYLISQLAGRTHRVVLTGDGGDEVQGGYSGARLFAARAALHGRLALPTLDRLPAAAGQWLARQRDAQTHWIRGAAFKAGRILGAGIDAVSDQLDGLHRLHGLFDATLQPALAIAGWHARFRQHWLNLPAQSELDRALAHDFSLYLPEDLCVKVDVASMAHAVETRAPLLDLDFTDACWAVKPGDRVRPWASKRIIRALIARHLPADCVLGPKLGFSIPLQRWLTAPATRAELDRNLRTGLPGMPWFNGPAAADELLRRDKIGLPSGVLRWRLLFLVHWARWHGSGS